MECFGTFQRQTWVESRANKYFKPPILSFRQINLPRSNADQDCNRNHALQHQPAYLNNDTRYSITNFDNLVHFWGWKAYSINQLVYRIISEMFSSGNIPKYEISLSWTNNIWKVSTQIFSKPTKPVWELFSE